MAYYPCGAEGTLHVASVTTYSYVDWMASTPYPVVRCLAGALIQENLLPTNASFLSRSRPLHPVTVETITHNAKQHSTTII